MAIFTVDRQKLSLWLATILFYCNLSFASPSPVVERIISLSPHTTEIAYAAGLGDKLIAVSAYSDYPPPAQKLAQVSSWQGLNLEKIVALKPDLVLAWRGGNPQRVIDQIIALGITVVYSDPESIQDIADDIRQLAIYSAKPELANRAADQLLAKTAALKKQYASAKPIPGLLQLGTQPLFTTSAATLQNQVLNLCGVENIFADSKVPWPQISREQVLIRQPKVIIIGGDARQIATIKTFWQGQLDLPVIAIEQDWFYRSGPRILLAAESLCQQLAKMNRISVMNNTLPTNPTSTTLESR